MRHEYKLIGFLNVFDIIPDFTYPIFEYNNLLYFQHGSNDKINEFIEIKDDIISKIIPLKSDKNFKIKISLDSKPIYAFQSEQNNMIYGTSDELCHFFESYKIPDNYLKNEIKDFYDEVNKKLPYNPTLFYYGTGRRKKAIARVRIYYGTGEITINDRDINDYFAMDSLKYLVKQPLILSNNTKDLDIICNVRGGGVAGQASAIRLGISKALLTYNNSLRPEFKSAGFLTRDSRVKERKKYGLKAARKAPQFSKR